MYMFYESTSLGQSMTATIINISMATSYHMNEERRQKKSNYEEREREREKKRTAVKIQIYPTFAIPRVTRSSRVRVSACGGEIS